MWRTIKRFSGIFGKIFFVVVLSLLNVQAHPMPNTDIAIRINENLVTLEIKIPVPELLLAFPKSEKITAENILTDERNFVENYFREHIKILSKSEIAQPYNITSLKIEKNSDEFVGEYQELSLTIEVAVREGFSPRDFVLEYYAVLHQVPTHFALVKITSDFNNGIFSEEKAVNVGAIRFDFSSHTVPQLIVNSNDSGKLNGFYNMVKLGMNHILTGFDHILFLLTLLIISPLAVSDGKWGLFQGSSYTVKRFLTISLAFTIGHSASLVFGAYNFLPINQKLIEILIAVSILITAVHGIKPLFNRREFLVALFFGIIHGIAFAEVLSSLHLASWQKALSILGFNVGIELMQIVIMFVVFPFLLVSRYKIYDSIRTFFAFSAIILACVWIVERTMGYSITAW